MVLVLFEIVGSFNNTLPIVELGTVCVFFGEVISNQPLDGGQIFWVGILSVDTDLINKYLQSNVEAELISYETISNLFDALNANNEIEYLLIRNIQSII